MRAPLSAIEPFISGVSMAIRGPAASTVSRVNTWPVGETGAPVCGAPGWPGKGVPGAAGRRRRRRAACRGRLGLLLRLLLGLLLLALLFHLRHADKILPGDQHDRREHDRKNAYFSGRSSRALSRARAPLADAFQGAREFGGDALKGHCKRRAPADQDVVVAGLRGKRGREAHDLAQPPPHAIALDCVADLLRYREADPGRGIVAARACLQDEAPRPAP